MQATWGEYPNLHGNFAFDQREIGILHALQKYHIDKIWLTRGGHIKQVIAK
jgi:hypothetical protein